MNRSFSIGPRVQPGPAWRVRAARAIEILFWRGCPRRQGLYSPACRRRWEEVAATRLPPQPPPHPMVLPSRCRTAHRPEQPKSCSVLVCSVSWYPHVARTARNKPQFATGASAAPVANCAATRAEGCTTYGIAHGSARHALRLVHLRRCIAACYSSERSTSSGRAGSIGAHRGFLSCQGCHPSPSVGVLRSDHGGRPTPSLPPLPTSICTRWMLPRRRPRRCCPMPRRCPMRTRLRQTVRATGTDAGVAALCPPSHGVLPVLWLRGSQLTADPLRHRPAGPCKPSRTPRKGGVERCPHAE